MIDTRNGKYYKNGTLTETRVHKAHITAKTKLWKIYACWIMYKREQQFYHVNI